MATKKIAFVIPSLGSGGAERVVTTLANDLSKKYNVTVITYTKKPPFYELNEKVELLHCLDCFNPSENILDAVISNLKLIRQLRKILKQKRIEIVMSFLTSANVLSIISGKLINIKVVISERNNPKEDKIQKIWSVLRRNIYPYADILVVQTDYIKLLFSDYIKKEKILILPNPLNPDLSRKKLKSTNRKKHILSVGRLTDQKNHEMLIRAFAMAEIKDWKLIIVGEGENRKKYTDIIANLDLEDEVSLIGRQKDIAYFYNSCSIFAFSSNYEGFPNALIEAMHFGMACISTDCPTGPSEIIQNKVNGLLIPINDTSKMSLGLKTLAENQDLRKRIGEKAMESIDSFEVNEVVDKWVSLIIKKK